MPKIFMESTKIPPSRTVAEIQRILGEYGASAVLVDYEGGEVSAVSFKFRRDGREIAFRLPCRWQELLKKIKAERKRERYDTDDEAKAKRVGWRQVRRLVEAQLAFLDTGQAQAEELFLGFAIVGPNETLFEKLEKSGWKFKQLTAGEE